LGSDARVAPFDPIAESALAVLLTGVDAVRKAIPRKFAEDLPVDAIAWAYQSTERLAVSLPALAGDLVSYVLEQDAREKHGPLFLRAIDAVLEDWHQLTGGSRSSAPRMSAATMRGAMRSVLEMTLDATLERHCALSKIRFIGGKRPVLAWLPARPDTAFFIGLSKLYERVEFFTSLDRLAALERLAARWYFRRYTVQHPGGRFDQFQRSREQEWSLAARSSLAHRASFLDTFMEHHGDRFTTEQKQQVARAVKQRVTGVFQVMKRYEDRSIVRNPLSDETFALREFNPEISYLEEDLILGSLLPVDRGFFLRSPGCVGARPVTPGGAVEWAGAWADTAKVEPPSIALEAVITTVFANATEPHEEPPFQSSAEARQAETNIFEALAAAGYATIVHDAGSPRVHSRHTGVPFANVLYLRAPKGVEPGLIDDRAQLPVLDRAVSEWLVALRAQVAAAEGGSRR
jgi:hypothetical protein